tara:strand:- start:66 stop:686 length:621 start_codon:yes stop_codon:yes gene_type:complete
MEAMKEMKDNQFDLAIVDPPYGLGDRLVKARIHLLGNKKGKTSRKLADNKISNWDKKIPSKEYFTQLKRVSTKQIIWGGNYFLDYLGKTDGLIVWDKMNGTNSMADAELAWQNVKGTTRMFRWHHFSGDRIDKIHPTQKPVKLYEWLLMNYANEGDKILDTHLGSGSIAIACHNLGFDLEGYELDKEYFEDANKRLKQHTNQQRLF